MNSRVVSLIFGLLRGRRSFKSVAVGLLLAGVVWFLQERGIGGNRGGGSSGAPAGKAPSEEWVHLEKCRFIKGRNSDGDSFHVKHEQGETEFRLYYADAPESKYRTYSGGDSNGKRIGEQGEYFGGLGREETTSVGKEGKDLVKKLLSQNDFEVVTKWENVYGPERKYCFVLVPWEGRKMYLHELLVEKGLARIHTLGRDLPEGRSYREQKSYLKGIERTAREKKLGAWGL